MKRTIVFATLFLCSFYTLLGQNRTFGNLTKEEYNLTEYPADPEAQAVVLYEKGNNYFKVVNRYVRLIKEVHVIVKILNKEGFNEGTIEIPFYHTDDSSEKVTDIRAVTHNDKCIINVLEKDIFTVDINENWKQTSFTFPELKEGSILEYSYTIISPYFFNLTGWDFQSNLPKLYSEFNAKIPANYRYNRDLKGSLQLTTNEADIESNCFSVEGFPKAADCEVLKYAMKDIPAFKEEEDFMLSARNYISTIEFELSEHQMFNGVQKKYTRSWKDVDREYKKDRDFGAQLTKKNFFEKRVPASLLTEGDNLTKAKNIYNYVRNHYNWNDKYGIYKDIRVKDAFDSKSGNIGEINISLINLLNAANIPTNMMLLSTRQHGLPKTNRAVITDFNYVVAKTTIDGKDYLLDASDKYIPFGVLPFRCLNYIGRVMDFKNDSYWQNIIPETNNKINVRGAITFDLENGLAEGRYHEVNTGYFAVAKNRVIASHSKDEYLDELEKDNANSIALTNYNFDKERSNEEITVEQFDLEIDELEQSNTFYFNPCVVTFFKKNPFVLNERTYPIDFGFNRRYSYLMSITVPEGFKVDKLPETLTETLPDNLGYFKFETVLKDNVIMVNLNIIINTTNYDAALYPALKQLFSKVIQAQNNSLIAFKKEGA